MRRKQRKRFITLVNKTTLHLLNGFTKYPGPNFSWDMFPEIVLHWVSIYWSLGLVSDPGGDPDPVRVKEAEDFVLNGPGKSIVLTIADRAVQERKELTVS